MKKRNFPFFWVFFAAFIIAMLIFWNIIIKSVNKSLVIYEQSQPELTVEEVLSKLSSEEAESMLEFAQSQNRFEDPSIYKNEYMNRIRGAELTYSKSSNSYDALAPVYDIYNGDDKVANIRLRLVSSEPLMFILTLQSWEVDTITPIYELGSEAVSVVVPDNYTVYFNDIAVEDTEKKDYLCELSGFEYVRPYTETPSLVMYGAEGFRYKPDVTVYDNLGRKVEIDESDYDKELGAYVIDSYTPSEMPVELSEYVLNAAITYSNYFSRDVEGCRNSVDPIRYMFPEDSYYLELAEVYRVNDMWMYSAHETPVFENVSVGNYIVYSEDCFSCDIYFDKKMTLTLNGQLRVDTTNTTFYYVNIDGNWVIADMQSVTSND